MCKGIILVYKGNAVFYYFTFELQRKLKDFYLLEEKWHFFLDVILHVGIIFSYVWI